MSQRIHTTELHHATDNSDEQQLSCIAFRSVSSYRIHDVQSSLQTARVQFVRCVRNSRNEVTLMGAT